MNFGFSEEQEMLREQVRRFMQDTCPMSTVRDLTQHDTAFSAALWRQLGDLGWLGLNIPEAYDGVGLGWVDLTVLLEESSRGLLPLPLLHHALAATALGRFGTEAQQQQWLPLLASGERVATLALYDDPNWIAEEAVELVGTWHNDTLHLSGRKRFVPHAQAADLFLLACRTNQEPALVIVEPAQVSVTGTPTIDRTKPMGNVQLDLELPKDAVVPLSGRELSFLTDCGAVAVTAEMVGAADACLQLTNAYAKERMQFGKPIGQYQGVKHRLAEMYVDVESFRSLLYYAAWCADEDGAALPRAVSLAKGYASDAFAQIGIDGVQLHGAIGFTAEYDAQLYLKRSKWARPLYGDSAYHLERVAALGGL